MKTMGFHPLSLVKVGNLQIVVKNFKKPAPAPAQIYRIYPVQGHFQNTGGLGASAAEVWDSGDIQLTNARRGVRTNCAESCLKKSNQPTNASVEGEGKADGRMTAGPRRGEGREAICKFFFHVQGGPQTGEMLTELKWEVINERRSRIPSGSPLLNK